MDLLPSIIVPIFASPSSLPLQVNVMIKFLWILSIILFCKLNVIRSKIYLLNCFWRFVSRPNEDSTIQDYILWRVLFFRIQYIKKETIGNENIHKCIYTCAVVYMSRVTAATFLFNCVFLAFIQSLFLIHWASKETYHFFRVTLTKIHSIKINHIWTKISFNTS